MVNFHRELISHLRVPVSPRLRVSASPCLPVPVSPRPRVAPSLRLLPSLGSTPLCSHVHLTRCFVKLVDIDRFLNRKMIATLHLP